VLPQARDSAPAAPPRARGGLCCEGIVLTTMQHERAKLTIVSGGQTGADRAALDFAIQQGIDHGGWCPRGRLAEDGPIASQYRLQETPGRHYPQRTEWNVRDTDITVLLTISPQVSGGTALTARIADKHRKPKLHLSRDGETSIQEAGQQLAAFAQQHRAFRINIAGPRGSQEPEIGQYVSAVLAAAFVS
jgi:Circularly permutated YpsA SLOG family